jgi:hypothetical protein
MNNEEYYFEGVIAWQDANKNLKHFAECCYHVPNRTALAADCKCSPRTVEYYAAAWSLYQELLREYGETVSRLWEDGEISLWRKSPQLRSTLHLSLEKTYEYIKTAIANSMTREQLAAHVDNAENDTPRWIRRLQSIIRLISPSKWDYKSELPPEVHVRYDCAVAAFVAALEEIAKASV